MASLTIAGPAPADPSVNCRRRYPDHLFPGPEPLVLSPGPPILCIVVDAEEEFQWGRPLTPGESGTASIRHQKRAQDLFACYGARPTYLVTFPIAADPVAAGVLREYAAEGHCDIGAQLHPWVTPPLAGDHEERSSFPGNLPRALERDKLLRLTDAVHSAFGQRPTVYKAGRYGIGPASAALLEEAGYLVDTSLMPRSNYAGSFGPDFSAYDYGPFWFGRHRRLLELPVTRAFSGRLLGYGAALYEEAGRWPWRPLHLRGALARLRMIERITLSPEGSDLAAMQRLTRALLQRGERIFTLSYHSPSLAPGNTPYVRSERDLAVFLDRLSGYLAFFRDELGGRLMSVGQLHAHLQAGALPLGDSGPRPRPAIAGDRRCLVVANTFPPVHGGSAIVYDSLARFGGGRVSVLAPQQDYRDGWPIAGWREFDREAPFPVHRLRLLRTRLQPGKVGAKQRAATLAADVLIRINMLWALRRIVRSDRIAVLCIGELVASGWLTWACRLLGLRSVIYVHGEEISTRTQYDDAGRRRRRALAAADGIVAVSRFTRDQLTGSYGVAPSKIELVSNGVDLARFTPRARPAALVQCYGLAGRRVLLTVSRLYARKGIDRVIESLPLVRLNCPDIVYLIVGEGTYRPTLEALVATHGLGDHVVFAGAVPDASLADHYALGDVFIMANREMPDGETEGFGLVFLEANACGVPVIAGRDGGSVDAVSDGVNGLLVNGDDPAAIAGTVLRLFGDDALRERLRTQGLAVAAGLGWDMRVGQFLRFCDGLR